MDTLEALHVGHRVRADRKGPPLGELEGPLLQKKDILLGTQVR